MGSKNKMTINCPVVVAVEGRDYFYMLLSQLCDAPEFQEVQLWDWADSKYSLSAGLEVLVKMPAFQRKQVRALGIIRDAEQDRTATETSLRESLRANGLGIPATQMEATRDNPHVGYLIVPHDKPSGCLENACLDASTLVSGHVACAEDFLQSVSPYHEPPLNANYQAKLKVHALIAGSGKNPAMTLGESALAGLWDFKRESIKVMLDFIRLMRDA
ncbi:MAG: hypothetical protein NTY19_50730 [Planctomycetota bacterium]|nr:hypothetical protein [Planctomycetota bacterium]